MKLSRKEIYNFMEDCYGMDSSEYDEWSMSELISQLKTTKYEKEISNYEACLDYNGK